jgi:hypothetical protein
MVGFLLGEGADIHARDEDGLAPIHGAAGAILSRWYRFAQYAH